MISGSNVWCITTWNTYNAFHNTEKTQHTILSFKKYRSSHSKVFLGKGVLKICRKFTGEHACRNAISIKLQSNEHLWTPLDGCFWKYLCCLFNIFFSEISLSEAEKEEIIEFEMDCVASMLRAKSSNGTG